jgi:GNAT superfamily N-acetyltransferase
MALWFLNFSTWDGVAGIFVEDLFVRPGFRRRGLARALLAALAAECLDHGYTRLSWAVLNWNADAIALYDGIGAQPQRDWTAYRLSGSRLAELAEPR